MTAKRLGQCNGRPGWRISVVAIKIRLFEASNRWLSGYARPSFGPSLERQSLFEFGNHAFLVRCSCNLAKPQNSTRCIGDTTRPPDNFGAERRA